MPGQCFYEILGSSELISFKTFFSFFIKHSKSAVLRAGMQPERCRAGGNYPRQMGRDGGRVAHGPASWGHPAGKRCWSDRLGTARHGAAAVPSILSSQGVWESRCFVPKAL